MTRNQVRANYDPAVVVFGGTGDIGSAIVAKLRNDGRNVISISRSKGNAVNEAPLPPSATNVKCNVLKPRELSQLFDALQEKGRRVDSVVLAIGALQQARLADTTERMWRNMIEVNLTAVFSICRLALRHMNKGGDIVVIGSRWGRSGGTDAIAYASSKGALRTFVTALQRELASTDIRITLVSPGSVNSRMSKKVDNSCANLYLEPNHIANLISFVLSCPRRVRFDEITVRASPYDYMTS